MRRRLPRFAPAGGKGTNRSACRERTSIPFTGVIGAVLGAIAGAAIGAVTGFGLVGILTFGLVAALGLGIVGGLVGGIGSLEDSTPSESAVVAGDGQRSVIGVHVDRREELEQAVAILRSHRADAIDLLDREGNRTSAA